MQDCLKKGRLKPAHGETHCCAKLKMRDVIYIKDELSKDSSMKNRHKLKDKFKVSISAICAIFYGNTWKTL